MSTLGRRVTVPASVSPGEVEPAIAPNTGRGGSAFRAGGWDCELVVVTVGSSGSIVVESVVLILDNAVTGWGSRGQGQ